MKKLYVIMLLVFSFSLAENMAQAVGDFGSGTTGNWGTAATWLICKTAGQWTDATVATGTPGVSNNVFIRSGHTITLDASGKNCKSLVIENGAIFKGNATQPTSSNVYVRLSGNITNNGIFGAALNDNICIECSTNVVLQGTGTYQICRIRPASNISGITITFDANATITYIGSSGSGGAGLMTLNTGNDNITYVINAGRTLTLVDYCNFATSSSTATSAVINSTFLINGTVIQQGSNGQLNLRTFPGKTCNFTVSNTGSYTVSRNCYIATSGTDTTVNFVVNGSFTSGTGNCDLTNPNQIITGTGSFTVPAAGTITVGAADGLNPTTGQVRTPTRNFNTGAYYAFSGTAAQVTGSDLPVTVSRLNINNAAGVTLTKSVKVSDTLYMNAGLLKLSNNTLTIGTAGAINISSPDATKMIVADNGACQLRKELAADGSFTFPVGDLTGTAEYSPVTLNLTALNYAVSAPAYVGVCLANVKHPSNLSKTDFLNRYWVLASSGLTSPVFNADFTFLPADVAGNINNIVGLRYISGIWSNVGKIDTAAKKVSLTIGQTLFGEYTGGEAAAIPVELVAFSASQIGSNVSLKWKTATETNNKGFEIERKTGSKFEVIGFVNGNGTSSEIHDYSYTDKLNSISAKNISYRLKQIDFDGTVNYSKDASVEVSAPTAFNLLQNYPNPFNPSTVISYQVPTNEFVNLTVFNSLGQQVALLVNEVKNPGTYNYTFDAGKLSSGIYYAVLKIGKQNEFVKTIKMSLIK